MNQASLDFCESISLAPCQDSNLNGSGLLIFAVRNRSRRLADIDERIKKIAGQRIAVKVRPPHQSVLGCREFVPLGANGLMQPLRTD
ncbi:hypothetical protein CEXT_103001 [Caerostris extrusa]|uniref:Uncharacterized protein n=1 Tax=Caerostris extrusa TaxID=172846 RepID=A0AAV4NWI6_CAEEX|nr:hypothetical protein CEXT_103001 [Caerostris extrusa]